MVETKRIDLTNSFWRFRFGLKQNETHEDQGITEKWYETGIEPHNDIGKDRLKVFVPSTWNMYKNRKNFYHFGTGWYQTNIYLPERWGIGDGKKVTLVFNGVNYRTTLWVNGTKVGYHEGGYTKFWFDIGKYCKFGSENLIVIQVDNRYQEGRIPWFQSPDWMNYGGIYRTVYLKVINPVSIDDYKICNKIYFKEPEGIEAKSANVDLIIRFLVSDSRLYQKNFQGSLIVTIKNSEMISSEELTINLQNQEEEFIRAEISLENVFLWSPDYPYLYDITFQLLDQNRRELDRESVRWGFRDFQIKGKDFYLNNKRIILRGISRHEDHPEVGCSMSPRLIYNDLNIMKDANINCIRTSHYPPYEKMVELADEMGFLVLEEIPICGLGKEQFNSAYLTNAQQQIWEMIHRDKNHCSVVAWILGDENNTTIPEGRHFFEEILKSARELDPFRYHSLISNHPLEDTVFDLIDFVCANIYIGWYDQFDTSPEKASDLLDKIWEKINDPNVTSLKPLVISEFGAGAVAGFKDFSDARWSENYQHDFLKTYIKMMMEKAFISGAIIWHFQDFRTSPFAGFMERPKEYNNKGIVDMHRRPKDAYYVVKKLYNLWKEWIDGTPR